jgi:ADP-ribose pyrophosphatase YjhB (NUDIX family)
MRWRVLIEPFVRPAMQGWWRLSRGTTLGVRGIAERADGCIALVRHTYVDGWHLPGGGVERGETAACAIGREMAEEAGVQLTGEPELIGIYSNHQWFRGDHVVVYRVREWAPCDTDCAGEIECVEWFSPQALPADVSGATLRRLQEVYHQAAREQTW